MPWRTEVIAHLPIAIDEEKIAEFCRARGICKMSLFGSVVRDDFDPARSDVDVLVEFLPDRLPGWEFSYWGEDLEPIFGCKVDLVSGVGKSIRPYVEKDLQPIYEQT